MRMMTALRIGDGVSVRWNNTLIVVTIIGPFCNVWRN